VNRGEDSRPTEEAILGHLDSAAKQLDLINRDYWVNSNWALSIPVDFESFDDEVEIKDYRDVRFAGNFFSYSKIKVAEIIGGQSVRALCLAFHEATILPLFEDLPERHILHVPVLALNEMDQLSRSGG
jgi:hypothetical protein